MSGNHISGCNEQNEFQPDTPVHTHQVTTGFLLAEILYHLLCLSVSLSVMLSGRYLFIFGLHIWPTAESFGEYFLPTKPCFKNINISISFGVTLNYSIFFLSYGCCILLKMKCKLLKVNATLWILWLPFLSIESMLWALRVFTPPMPMKLGKLKP